MRTIVSRQSCRLAAVGVYEHSADGRSAPLKEPVVDKRVLGLPIVLAEIPTSARGLFSDRMAARSTRSRAEIRVLRVYHGGRDPRHRCRERALVDLGAEITLVVPNVWPDAGAELQLSTEPFRVIALPVRRGGDVNRHAYSDIRSLRRVLDETRPDVLDIHEEPVSVAAHQWLRAADGRVPVVMYSAQNVDKRYPPPFFLYERDAHAYVSAFYPCSRQAAAVLRGKGFAGAIEIVELGYEDACFRPGTQIAEASEIALALVGRLVPEKGVTDAVRTVARIHAERPARLVICGSGPEGAHALDLAAALGIADRVHLRPWQTQEALATTLRASHVLLVPSRASDTWVEQFGRVIVEAQACGAIVAGYATGAIPDVAGGGAVVVPSGDVAGLAAGIVRVLSDTAEFTVRREAGWRLAARRTWRAVAQLQLGLYRRVAGRPPMRHELPLSPRQRRTVARAEFGPTASTLRGLRPYALPVLRHGGAIAVTLATATDAMVELAASLRGDLNVTAGVSYPPGLRARSTAWPCRLGGCPCADYYQRHETSPRVSVARCHPNDPVRLGASPPSR